jgi:hypothetical protein
LLINHLELISAELVPDLGVPEFVLCLEARGGEVTVSSKMAQGRCSAMLSVVLLLVSAAAVVQGATYTVGGNSGWTIPGNRNTSTTYLTDWLADKTFVQGDIVIFTYSAAMHNVFTVNAAAYNACTLTSPILRSATGNDSLTLAAGANYYICGIPGHCASNQKIAITATAATPGTITPPAAPGTPAAPAPNNAAGNVVTVAQVMAAVMVSLVASLAL